MNGFNRSLVVVLGVDRYSLGIPVLRTAVADARSVARRLKEKHGYWGLAVDGCRSRARWSSTRHFAVVPEVIPAERYERFIRDAAWQALASAACDQKALDVVEGPSDRRTR